MFVHLTDVVAFLMAAGYVLTEVPLVETSAESFSVEYAFEEEGNFFLVCKVAQYIKNNSIIYGLC